MTPRRRVALITGTSRGIGAATASVPAQRGFRAVVNYHASAEQAEEVVAAITAAGGEAVAIQTDVTPPGDLAHMVVDINKQWDSLVVHNALIPFAITSFAELTWEQLGGKLDRELRAAFLITKAVLPGMISGGYGRLIYRSTGLSRRPRDGMITLGTAKATLDQFVWFIALELEPRGNTANLVAPATVEGTAVTQRLTREKMDLRGRRLAVHAAHTAPGCFMIGATSRPLEIGGGPLHRPSARRRRSVVVHRFDDRKPP